MPVRQHSLVEIGHEIISMAFLSLPLIQVGAVVSYWRKDVHLVLVNRSVDRLTDRSDMTIVADWDIKEHSNKQAEAFHIVVNRL